MFAKLDVNGDGACDLYKFFKSEQADEDGNSDITWNFTKFLVDRTGAVVARYAPATTPEELGKALSSYL